jgi:alpha-1,3-mannosyltransferase
MDDHRIGRQALPRRWIFLAIGVLITFWLFWLKPYQPSTPRVPEFQNTTDQRVDELYHRPTIFSYHRAPGDTRGKPSVSTLASLQDLGSKISGFRRPECTFARWQQQRYAPLRQSNTTIFFALNLIDAEIVMPTFLKELPTLLEYLGPQKVHVSIAENGSHDKTNYFLHLLAAALDDLGTSYTIVARGESYRPSKEDHHRINILAAVRNEAMKPLYDGKVAEKMPNGRFDTVLFINDIIYCAVDVLEVLLQYQEQKADMACSVDWADYVIYDRWVLRTMSGRTSYDFKDMVNYFNGPGEWGKRPVPEMLPSEPVDRTRIKSLLPTQVFSCWNGMAAIKASAFLPPHSIRFREATNDPDRKITDKQSECFLLPVDLWKGGMGRILIAPRAAVAYNIENYERQRHDRDQPRTGTPAAGIASQEQIAWYKDPPAQIAYQDYANWFSAERWGPWNEA